MIWLSVNRDFFISVDPFRWKKFYFSALRILGGITRRTPSAARNIHQPRGRSHITLGTKNARQVIPSGNATLLLKRKGKLPRTHWTIFGPPIYPNYSIRQNVGCIVLGATHQRINAHLIFLDQDKQDARKRLRSAHRCLRKTGPENEKPG
jgi:hypothetical protein